MVQQKSGLTESANATSNTGKAEQVATIAPPPVLPPKPLKTLQPDESNASGSEQKRNHSMVVR